MDNVNGIDLGDDKSFQKAIDYFLSKTPMSEKEFEKLEEAAKRKAFWIKGVMKADVCQSVFKELAKAVDSKLTLKQFQKAIGDKLKKEWKRNGDDPKNPSARIETIFRTNCQKSYSAGRYKQHTSPITLKLRPFWRLKTKNDNRISDICQPLSNITLPASDPFWDTHIPPLHHCCRSKIIALRKNQVKPEDISTIPKDIPQPKDGFGSPPIEDDENETPDLSKYPKAIADKLRQAQQMKNNQRQLTE